MIKNKVPDSTGLLQMIYFKRLVTQAGFADDMHLSRSYVNSVVQRLKAAHLLKEVGVEESRSGRRRVLLEVNPDLAHLIGVDIGTANVRIVVTDFLGRTLSSKRLPSRLSEGQDRLFERVHGQIRELLASDPLISAIGVSQSGVINRATGELLSWPKVSGWRNVPLKQIIESEYDLPTAVDDSARTMALAERTFGQGRQVNDFVHVSIGMGVGAAIFTQGRLHYGSDGFAGELGHITIDEEGEICSCGNRGCLEVCASGWAIISKAKLRLQKGVDSVLLQMLEGDLERLSVEAIVEAAQAGDKLSRMILKEAAEHLGTGLADVLNLLNPRKIILGGAVPQVAGSMLMDPLMATLKERALPQVTQHLEVSISSLGDDAAAIGAAILVGETLVSSDSSFRTLLERGENALYQASHQTQLGADSR